MIQRIAARFRRLEPVLVAGVLWTLYLVTAPRTVVLEDDGLFILSSWFLGIEHPPGYPVYVLLGKLATLWPFGSPAWRVHALSGLFAALACAVVYQIGRLLIPGRAPALLAALGLGVSATFWSQAIIADVYSLHALLFFLLLWLSLRYGADPAAVRRSSVPTGAFALLFGLGLANHWPLLLLSAPGLLLLWWPARRALPRQLPSMVLAFCLGLLPYLWLVWRSQMQPEISFQGPIDSWREFLDFVLRRTYSGVDRSAAVGVSDKLAYGAGLMRQALDQLLLPGAVLAALGFVSQWRRWGWLRAAAVTLAFAGPTLLLLWLLDFDHDPMQREAFRVYPVVAWGILAVWAALGLDVLGERWLPARRKTVRAGLAGLVVGLALVVHWQRNDRADDWFAQALAQQLLDGVPAGGVLLLSGDVQTAASAYLHHVQAVRPDLLLLSKHALMLEPKLFDPYSTPVGARADILARFVEDADRPVSQLAGAEGGRGTLSWLLFTVLPADQVPADGANAEDAAIRYRLLDGERALLLRMVSQGAFLDGWSELMRRALLTRFVIFRTQAELAGQWTETDPALAEVWQSILQLPGPALMRAALLSDADHMAHLPEINTLLRRFAEDADGAWIGKRDLARFYNVNLRDAQLRGEAERVRTILRRSLALWPGPENPAYAVQARLDQVDAGTR